MPCPSNSVDTLDIILTVSELIQPTLTDLKAISIVIAPKRNRIRLGCDDRIKTEKAQNLKLAIRFSLFGAITKPVFRVPFIPVFAIITIYDY